MEAHVGCSGWFYWHWRGIFYPDTKRTDGWFKHYTAHFNTVELNAPFYSWPKAATVRAWVRNAPEGFRYSVKVNREITHERRLVRTGRLVTQFCRIEEILGAKLGCFLFQFPPSYKFTRSRLRSIVAQIAAVSPPRHFWPSEPERKHVEESRGESFKVARRDPSTPLRSAQDDDAGKRVAHRQLMEGRAPASPRCAIEFRHRSWWRQSVYRAFAQYGLIFCAVSAPRLPDELIKTTDTVYLRLHGRSRWYRHDYSGAELDDWMHKLAQSGAREAWIYFDNDREGFAIRNAQALIGRLREAGISIR